GDGRDEEEEDHHHAVHGEELVVCLRLHHVARGRDQLQADQGGEDAADGEHDRDAGQVEEGDPLVVGGEEPGADAVADVEVVDALAGRRGRPLRRRRRGRGPAVRLGDAVRAHGLRGAGGAPSWSLTPPAPGLAPTSAPGACSDWMYAMSCMTPSSLTRPWKVGMMGWYPSTTFAVGVRIDSRT